MPVIDDSVEDIFNFNRFLWKNSLWIEEIL